MLASMGRNPLMFYLINFFANSIQEKRIGEALQKTDGCSWYGGLGKVKIEFKKEA
jgi:hypothetical protein